MYGRIYRRAPHALINASALLKCAIHSFRSSFVSADSKCLQWKRIKKINETFVNNSNA